MEKERGEGDGGWDTGVLRSHRDDYPAQLFAALTKVSEELGREMYLVGGTVRDWLLEIAPNDLDFTVDCDAVHCCRTLIRVLAGGTFVPLGAAEEDAGRVVWRGLIIDFSSFREGAGTIEEDLCLRDFTINAMGLAFSAFVDEALPLLLIDPLNGRQDLGQGILRVCPRAFVSDPLRMLRGYRLWARFGFVLEDETLAAIREHGHLLSRVSVERISYEMNLIMGSARAHEVIAAMAESGLLFLVIPELQQGVGLEQPESHHLDVFHHGLAALGYMEKILATPELFYPECQEMLRDYLAQPGIREVLKWSALLHDLGKPSTHEIREDKGGRITFYNHDEVGRELVQHLGRELRWSNDNRDRAAALVGMHMHPFHLCNVRRKQGLSKKACLKLCRRAGDDLIGLFFLAMADSLAGKGEMKPEAMEEELDHLLCEILEIYNKDIAPALSGPRFITGKDLIEHFSLQPGPYFSQILDELQEAQVEGDVSNRAEALLWVRNYLKRFQGPVE
ncbi:MAG: HDIG domain-containing protein [Proteobacteria bacterium]|nr:HDIG domain-containing protein [Pseudomonadota bacterium]MBU1419136.1 HDIG domain-containing protein [Pseudomonadota bacterium]MBU1455094.1 HDIG domain-containing protein [Pseudomonadota bacterium]